MRLHRPFYRLPLRFDVQRLLAEMESFAAEAWLPHPQGYPGNWALPLIALDGSTHDQGTVGAMKPTPHLARAPYMRQVFASLQAPVGRSRLMRIEAGAQATPHVDTNYYWAQRVRLHVPIVTHPSVRFSCGDEAVHMQPGEAWIFDNWRLHNVINPSTQARVHLVMDTVGSDSFWGLLDAAENTAVAISYDPHNNAAFSVEAFNFPVVMSPWELLHWSTRVCGELAASAEATRLRHLQDRLHHAWRALWAQFADTPAGWPYYREVLDRWKVEVAQIGHQKLPNGVWADGALLKWIGDAALNVDLVPEGQRASPVKGAAAAEAPASDAAIAASKAPTLAKSPVTKLEAPVFIVAAPRSGSTLLFETLARAANVYTIGGESHGLIEQFPELTPEHRNFASNRLTASDATPQIACALRDAFVTALRDRDGNAPPAEGRLRFLEKTPKNALRVPFLAKVFPDARFIFMHRDARANIASIMEAWNSGRFVTYPNLHGWTGKPWSLLLIPGWQALRGASLAQVAAAQWRSANEAILQDLDQIPKSRWCTVSYDDFLQRPQQEVERLAQFTGLVWDTQLGKLPLSRHTVTPPARDKWRKHEAAIQPLLPDLEPLRQRLHSAETRTIPQKSDPAPTPVALPPTEAHFKSIHTTGFSQLLQDARASVFVSTYQAGKVVILRSEHSALNTHFRDFRKPMGIALRQGRLAVGTEIDIQTFCNVPAVVPSLPGGVKHDGCFLRRQQHVTGDIQIHELAWSGDTLWYVNTSFSCLCTLDPDYSFVPRWRPLFITALTPEDRCHLNGLALVEGKPRYVTALGKSDTPGGWRAKKESGGLVIDVVSNAIVATGLCMPHSPRWYDGNLWILNSGQGGIGTIDLATGAYEEVARLPGFTRGLDFIGRYALVGLSQIRETATFNAIPIANTPVEERACGVWVVDIKTGAIVAFTKFTGAVQEIFAVQVGQGIAFPELVTDDKNLLARSYVVPDAALQDVPEKLRRRSA